MQFNYENPTEAKYVKDITVNTTETTILEITDLNYVRQSQITAYFKATLGSATSVKIRYYFSPDGGTTYYQVPIRNDITGVLSDNPTVLDSTTPSKSGIIYVVEDIPFSGTTALKITGQAVGANATMNKCSVYVRDN